MRLLLAIHPLWTNTRKFQRFLREQFALDPNTHLLFFALDKIDERKFEKLKKKFPGKRNRFRLIEAQISGLPSFRSRTEFGPHNASYLTTLLSLRESADINEPVEMVSFGGATEFCYRNINEPAHKIAKSVFGSRLRAQSTHLPFVYGRPKRKILRPRTRKKRRSR